MDSHGIYPKQLSTPSFAHGRWFSKVQGATGSPLEAADGGRMDSIVGVFSNGCSSRQKNVHMIVYVCVCTVCVLYMYIHVIICRGNNFDPYNSISTLHIYMYVYIYIFQYIYVTIMRVSGYPGDLHHL